MTESNFISESDFEKLLDSIPNQLHKNTRMSEEDWRMLFRVMYGCALRIKECTKLTPQSFDLDNRILTLAETKTGWKHCKCSKWESIPNSKQKKLAYADKDCKKCHGEGWIRVAQKTTILPGDVKDLKRYLAGRAEHLVLWPVNRVTIWAKFKQMCEDANLHFHFEKKERAFDDNPYLLRSSRAKIMERLQAPHSYVKLKLRHTLGSDVTLAYTMPDINALLGWENEAYKVRMVKV